MKTKIEIKNKITGKILFEFETENNSVKKTVMEAVNKRAYLGGVYLRGIKILKTSVFTGLYEYIAMPIISEDNQHYIRLGCYTRLLSEWENDFWNNNSEFPNDGGLKSEYRKLAYETCKKWLELNK